MLNFSIKRTVPVVLQTEGAECGLASLCMVASYFDYKIDLPAMRAKYSISLKGTTLADVMRIATELKLVSRPLRVELSYMSQLHLPCILHWDFNHFVVLTNASNNRFVIHDPAVGRRELSKEEFSKHFTGVVLELTRATEFVAKNERQKVSIAPLIGKVPGLSTAVIQILILALTLQIFTVIGPFYMQWVVDEAVVARDNDLIAVLGIGFLLLALMQAGVTAFRAWILMIAGTTLNLQMLSNLFRHLIRLPMDWFDKRHLGDITSRFDSVEVIQRTLTSSFIEALIDGVMVAITFALMLFYSVKLTAIAVIAAVLYAILRVVLYRPMRLATEEHIVRSAKQHSHFLETVRGMQSIKLFNREDLRSTAWQNLAVEQFNASVKTQRLRILYQALNGSLFGIENVLTVWLGALLILDTKNGTGFSIGMLFAFIAFKTQFVQRISGLIEKIIEFHMLGLHVDRIGDIVTTKTEPRPQLNIACNLRESGQIELRNLSFRYSDAEPYILRDVNLTIRPNESVAIIGPSGCGKSTLIKLMLGLLTPTEGQIEVGGVGLSKLGIAQYRSMASSVMQDDQLFAGSILENICFFDLQPDHDRIYEVAKLADVYDDIVAMPMQFNTLVGDMGTVLSGGQKQRIILARALYRRPKILFLDEATSHLDVARERSVNSAIKSLQLTRVIVAHRPETIASADRVVVLNGGKVVSQMGVIDGNSKKGEVLIS